MIFIKRKILNKRLKSLRANLRNILLEAIFHRISYLYEIDRILEETNTTIEKINNEIKELERIHNNSICQCSNGCGCPNSLKNPGRFHPTDLNMGYSLFLKKWYCEHCFKWIKRNRQRLEKVSNPYFLSNES